MVDGRGGPAFPVVFFDGERETDIGDVSIHPTLDYKTFQLILSRRIGISPNQISIYLVDLKTDHKSQFSKDRRRIPITGKVNFGLICRQKDCLFLVVLKRSRKSRNRRERTVNGGEFANLLPENELSPPSMLSLPENMVLLQRNQQLPFYDQITQSELADLNDRLQSLRIQRENYPMAMAKMNLSSPNFSSGPGPNPFSIPNPSMDPIHKIDDWHRIPSTTAMMTNNENKRAYCEECVNEEKYGSTTSFHPCVYDAAITRFTTPFGPISRPKKQFR